MRRIPKLMSVLAAIGLAAGLTLAGTGTARADVIPPVAQWIPIHNPYLHAKINTLCFEDPNASTASGTVVQLGHCDGYTPNGVPQRWVFIQPEDNNGNPIYDSNGSSVYEVYNLAAGKCLTSQSVEVGTPLTLGTCNRATTTGAIWWELPTANNPAGPDFMLRTWPVDFSDSCAAANDFDDNIPTRLIVAPCNASDTRQLFNLG